MTSGKSKPIKEEQHRSVVHTRLKESSTAPVERFQRDTVVGTFVVPFEPTRHNNGVQGLHSAVREFINAPTGCSGRWCRTQMGSRYEHK